MDATVRWVILAAVLLAALSSADPEHAERGPTPRRVLGPEDVPRLVTELGDPSFRTRERASLELVRLEPSAVPALLRAALDPDAERAQRAEQALHRMKRGAVASLFEAMDGTDEPIARKAREVLEKRYGKPLADRAVLQRFLGSRASPRETAAAALRTGCGMRACHGPAELRGPTAATATLFLDGVGLSYDAVMKAFPGGQSGIRAHRWLEGSQRIAIQMWRLAASEEAAP